MKRAASSRGDSSGSSCASCLKGADAGHMKDVENVTGRMGEGEAVTPAEEVKNIVTADDTESAETVFRKFVSSIRSRTRTDLPMQRANAICVMLQSL